MGIEAELVISKRYRGIKNWFTIELPHGYYTFDPLDLQKIGLSWVNDDKCLGVFKPQANDGMDARYSNLVRWIYTPYDPYTYESVRRQLFKPGLPEKHSIYFRGSLRHGRRMDYAAFSLMISPNRRIQQIEYLKEMANTRMALSLRGMASLNHREFEAFGLGVPVLMMTPSANLYDPLIPDYHYIAVSREHNFVDRYYQTIGDTEFLNFVRMNALAWYNRNVAPPNCFQFIHSKIQETSPPPCLTPFGISL